MPGAVNIDQILMQPDAAAGGSLRNFGRADGVGGGESVHGDGGRTQADVNVAAGGVVFALLQVRRREGRTDAGSSERRASVMRPSR